ncbi:MAG TPA: DUF3575 domain-containing protein [Chitinophagaceae bacterium]
MRTLNIFLLTIMLGQMAIAQGPQNTTKTATSRYDSRYYKATLFAKVNFLSLFDPGAPTIQPGLEYRFNKRIAIEASYGIPVYVFRESRPTDTTYFRCYKIKAGLKFYPGKDPRFYFSPEFFFTRRERNKYNGVVTGKDGINYEYRYAEMVKSIVGMALKFGVVGPLSERLCVEAAVGFGPRFVHLKMNASNLDRADFVRSMFKFNTDKIGTSYGIHMMSEFKLGYIIN